ncbi:hypothetical protein OSC52_09540 [Clostridium pasteurianum]|uniref:hypothetical protein n=1 Tax=Clostridium pasteurianum TaxID=1501 RepID=UPI002260E102|nr:hypothetical protein [Clostridium pasteurianum]UZW16036.1 hypothetical protein OSC52_09540 [Clostridium pasteurianum]
MKICVVYSNDYKEKLMRKNMVESGFRIKYERLIIMLLVIRNILYINSTSSAICIGIHSIFKILIKSINYMN